jgi:hypothetical protein
MPFVSSRQPDHPGPDGAGPPGDPVHRPGPAPRGRADRGGPGRDRGRAVSPVLPAHARGYQAARRRGGPAAGSCQRRADPAEPVRKAFHAVPGHRLTAAQVSQLNTPFITLSVVSDLVPVALWLWMARASGQGRNWARSLSTALFGLATLDLTGAFRTPVIRLEIVPMLFGPAVPWLAGAAAVWQLWRRPLPPSSSRMVTRGCHQNGTVTRAAPAPAVTARTRPYSRRSRRNVKTTVQETAVARGQPDHRGDRGALGRPALRPLRHPNAASLTPRRECQAPGAAGC